MVSVMRLRRWLPAAATVVVTLGVCRVACADSLSPYVWFWPGVVSITPFYAFPASLLAALVERPFLAAGGIRRRALVVSLQANFVSALVGILMLPFGWPALYLAGPLWCAAAFGVSCWVEAAYVRRFSKAISWGWIVAANVISSALLMTIPPFTLGNRNRGLAWALAPFETSLIVSSLLASVAIFLASFAWRVPREEPLDSPDAHASASRESSREAEPLVVELAPSPGAIEEPRA